MSVAINVDGHMKRGISSVEPLRTTFLYIHSLIRLQGSLLNCAQAQFYLYFITTFTVYQSENYDFICSVTRKLKQNAEIVT
jgi:hypothetical protein